MSVGSRWRTAGLLLLAATFTVGLTFATLELPYRADRFLQEKIRTPDGDSHSNDMSRFKAEIFITHYHLRLVGYLCLATTLLLIVGGFASRRTGWATLGALAFMLPVFAQFASVMFFLAGLGFLNVMWLPVLDCTFDTQELARVIRAPYDLLAWLLRTMGLEPYWPLVLLFVGGGLLLFFLGTAAWLLSRAREQPVADSWVYRISRHPQYLGWILWSYGMYLLLMRGIYPKRSWGIDASLPWLLSTMVIVTVALLEELHMSRRLGQVYDDYRRATAFLFPIPRRVLPIASAPFRFFFKKDFPTRKREVFLVTGMLMLLLVGASAFLYGSGLDRTRRLLMSADARTVAMEDIVRRMRETPDTRQQRALAHELARFGAPAVEPLTALLRDPVPELRIEAANRLRLLDAPAAVPALVAALQDSLATVRGFALVALARAGANAAKEPMLPLLQDPEGWVRSTAVTSLARLGAQEVVLPAMRALETEGEWHRIACIDALGTLQADEAVPALVIQLEDPSPRVRRSAAIALLRIESSRARSALERAAKDDDWETRIYAVEALKRLDRAERHSELENHHRVTP